MQCDRVDLQEGQQAFVPQHCMKLSSVSDTVLDPTHPDRAALESAIVSDLSASIGVHPSTIRLRNIRNHDSCHARRLQHQSKFTFGGRRVLSSHMNIPITFDFVVDVINTGHADASSLIATLAISSPYITLNTVNNNVPSLLVNGQYSTIFNVTLIVSPGRKAGIRFLDVSLSICAFSYFCIKFVIFFIPVFFYVLANLV